MHLLYRYRHPRHDARPLCVPRALAAAGATCSLEQPRYRPQPTTGTLLLLARQADRVEEGLWRRACPSKAGRTCCCLASCLPRPHHPLRLRPSLLHPCRSRDAVVGLEERVAVPRERERCITKKKRGVVSAVGERGRHPSPAKSNECLSSIKRHET